MKKILKSDLKCVPIQKIVFLSTCKGAPVNSFEPRNTPGQHVREDGVVYVNDICYGDKYPNSHMDIYYQNEDRSVKRPTFIYMHGGGCIFGDKVAGDPIAADVGGDVKFCVDVALQGFNVIAANYALAPEYRFPTQLEQVDQMLVYLTEHQEELGLDMEHVFLGGGSAGANLSEIYGALLTCPNYAKKIEVTPSIRKEQLLGLIIDEASLSARNYEENMNAMFGCWAGADHPSEKEEVTILFDVTKWIQDSYIPSFINSSNMEIWFKDSADDLAEVLEKNGTVYEYFYRGSECDQLEHGYMKRYEENQYAKECYEHMLAFMKSRIKEALN